MIGDSGNLRPQPRKELEGNYRRLSLLERDKTDFIGSSRELLISGFLAVSALFTYIIT